MTHKAGQLIICVTHLKCYCKKNKWFSGIPNPSVAVKVSCPGARRPEVLGVSTDWGEERRIVDSTAALTRAEWELLHLAKMGCWKGEIVWRGEEEGEKIRVHSASLREEGPNRWDLSWHLMNSETLQGTGAKRPLTKVVVFISKSTETILGKLYGGQETKTEGCEVVVGRRA